MSYTRATVAAIACALSIIGGTLAACIVVSDAAASQYPPARSVALSDATFPPQAILYVQPGATRCISVRQAFATTETSAYRWNGSALSAQRWNRAHDRTYWRDARHGGRVRFDGVCVSNGTHAPILLAVWS